MNDDAKRSMRASDIPREIRTLARVDDVVSQYVNAYIRGEYQSLSELLIDLAVGLVTAKTRLEDLAFKQALDRPPPVFQLQCQPGGSCPLKPAEPESELAVRRADDKNPPCKGRAKITLRKIARRKGGMRIDP